MVISKRAYFNSNPMCVRARERKVTVARREGKGRRKVLFETLPDNTIKRNLAENLCMTPLQRQWLQDSVVQLSGQRRPREARVSIV